MPNSKRILVADDDPAIVDAISYMLEDEGYQVLATVDGATIANMAKQQPDLLLLDIWMSGHDGRDICRTLKQQSTTKNIPVIMVSANRDCRAIAMQAGADDFLLKPFEMEELLTKIAKLT